MLIPILPLFILPDQSRTPHFFLAGREGSKSLQVVAATALLLLLFDLGSHWCVHLGYPDDVSVYTPRLPTHSRLPGLLPSPWVYHPWSVSHVYDFPDPPAAGQLLTEFLAALQLFHCDLTFQSYVLYTLLFPLSHITPEWHPSTCAFWPSPPPLAPRCPPIGGSRPALSGYSFPTACGESVESPPGAFILHSSFL